MKTINKKYEFTDETIRHNGHTLHRIRAIRDFGDVRKGDLGGYVEIEENLCHEDTCWIYNKAKVYEYGELYDDAKIYNEVEVFGYAEVYGSAKLYDFVKVYDNACVFQNAELAGRIEIYDDAWLYKDIKFLGTLKISNYSEINRLLKMQAKINKVFGIKSNTLIKDFVKIKGQTNFQQQ